MYFRCPYQANVMKILEIVSKIIVCMGLLRKERMAYSRWHKRSSE